MVVRGGGFRRGVLVVEFLAEVEEVARVEAKEAAEGQACVADIQRIATMRAGVDGVEAIGDWLAVPVVELDLPAAATEASLEADVLEGGQPGLGVELQAVKLDATADALLRVDGRARPALPPRAAPQVAVTDAPLHRFNSQVVPVVCDAHDVIAT